ncbi:MAG TPA: hypothetical protein VFS92_10660 [Planctomycetota bacterium]|nr:hypothetical protein [Planctomycetota bacterium]
MGIDPPFAKSLAAALALLWLALVAVALPHPEGNRFLPNLRLRPRLAILGALAFGMLFAGIAAWEHGGVPGPEELLLPGWGAALEEPARTLSSGAALVAIAVVLAGIGGWIGPRSRVAARGAMLFAVVLLAGAIWPAFSIPRWCAWLGAPEDLPAPLPLAAYRPDYDPARWIDAWSRVLHPLAPWGMGIALAGIAAGVVLFRRATARADAPGREAACAAVACAGLLAMCGAALEFEKQAAWGGHDSRFEEWTTPDGDGGLTSFRLNPRILDYVCITKPTRCPLCALDTETEIQSEIETVADAELTVLESDVSPLEDPESPLESVVTIPESVSTIWLRGSYSNWSIRWSRPYSSWFNIDPPPSEPEMPRPVSTPLTWFALGVGSFAVLFGEFHLRGRRLLRDPATGEAIPSAA